MLTCVIARSAAFVSALAVALAIGTPGAASAAPAGDGGGLPGILDLDTQMQIDDLFATEDPTILSSDPGVIKFGPFESDTTDSGTCGPDWAADHVFRFFEVKLVSSVGGLNTYRVIEKFKNGTFTTILGPSPGACDNSDGTPPGAVNAGVQGAFHGYDAITVMSTSLNPNATCPSYPPGCVSTNQFLFSAFGPAGPATRNDYAFFFHYVADQPNSLVFHEWRNASCSRGGNHGDIASASGSAVAVPFCP